MKLKTKTSPIPNGFDFRFKNLTSWRPHDASRSSWTLLANEVQAVITANPTMARNYSWPTSRAAIEQMIEDYNCRLCVVNQWWDYLEGGRAAAIPFLEAQSQSRVPGDARAAAAGSTKPPGWFKELGQIATGARTLADWLGNGGKPVPNELAESRASVCVECPMNNKGDWTSLFTVPAANLIRRQLEQRKEMKLSTTHDEKLGVCDGCLCPLRLKVHVPLADIKAHMEPDISLAPGCWITKEGTVNVDT